MNNKAKLILLAIVPLGVTSCGQAKTYADHLDDYVVTMKYREDFNILQLTDIHWNYNSSTLSSRRYLDKVIEEAHKHVKQQIDDKAFS